ncbi:MAG: hypothetical protein V7L00_06230 [Nostoc sp.]
MLDFSSQSDLVNYLPQPHQED